MKCIVCVDVVIAFRESETELKTRVVPERCSGVRKRCSVFGVRFGFPNAFGLNNVFGLNSVRLFVRVLSVRCSCSWYYIFIRVRVRVR